MATEVLSVPEEYLEDVIRVIQVGLAGTLRDGINEDVRAHLVLWCEEEAEYLHRD